MVKKVLIQVVSVFTLVFGTCYQSVLALADNVGQFEIHSSKVMDKDGKAVERVKAGSTQKLVFDMTINNKDGDKASGTTDVFIPETQLKVMKAKVNATSSIPDAKASLYMEKNRKLRLKWSGVKHTARFTLEVPVEIGNPMTLTDLPVAVDDATSYTQQMIVLAEDAKDDAVSEAITENELPTDLTLQLDNYLQQVKAQKEQQAQQEADDQAQKAQDEADAEAEAQKAEEEEKAAQKKAAAEKKKAAEAKKAAAAKLAKKEKLEAEEKAKAEKAAEQEKENQEADEQQETEETAKVLQRSSIQGSEKDSRATTRANRNLEDILKKSDNTPVSFFDQIQLTMAGEDPITIDQDSSGQFFDPETMKKSSFKLNYQWSIDGINEKLDELDVNEPIGAGDSYTFEIQGLNSLLNEVRDAEIRDKDTNLLLGYYSVINSGSNQIVTIEFTEAGARYGSEFEMTIEQSYSSTGPITFEWNDGAVISIQPSEIIGALDKSGKFISGNEIEWTIELKTEKFSDQLEGDLKFEDIVLNDLLSVGDHVFSGDVKFSARYSDEDEDSLTNNFSIKRELDNDNKPIDTDSLQIVGHGTETVKQGSTIILTIVSQYNVSDSGTSLFKNEVSGEVANLTLNMAKGKVSNDVASKEFIGSADGNYQWNVKADLDRFTFTKDNVANIVITDTISGPHAFTEDPIIGITIGGKDAFDYFEPETTGNELVLTVKKNDEDDYSELLDLINTGNGELVLSYTTTYNGEEGSFSEMENSVALSIFNQNFGSGSGEVSPGGLLNKDGELNYGDYQPGGKFETTWTLKINKDQLKYTDLSIVDVLPGELVNGSVKISENLGDNYVPLNNDLYETGYSDGSKDNNGVYKFSTDSDDGEKNAIQFNFGNEYSGKTIYIQFKTVQSWSDIEETGKKDGYIRNTAQAVLNNYNGIIEEDDASVTVPYRLHNDAFKDGQNVIKDKENSSVSWTIGIGTKLENTFGPEDDQINTVTVNDVVNKDINYLTLSKDPKDYKLYAIDANKAGTELNLGAELKNYELKLTGDGKIEITFMEDSDATEPSEGVHSFALVFSTPINFDAWQKDGGEEVPKRFEFVNKATIQYGDSTETLEVEAETSISSDGVYLKKESDGHEGNFLKWNALINPDGKDLEGLEITDTLKGNHSVILTDDEKFKLYNAEVEYVEDNGNLVPEKLSHDEDNPLIKGVDYVVEPASNNKGFTLKFLKSIDNPIYMEYQTYASAEGGTFENALSVSSSGYKGTSSSKITIQAHGLTKYNAVRLQKIDGSDNDEPLSGAQFKLQELKTNGDADNEEDWVDAKDPNGSEYGIKTSDSSGYVEFQGLAPRETYRVIEVKALDGYSNAMEPMIFLPKESDEWSGEVQKIRNWKIGEKGNLDISKFIDGLSSSDVFEFEIYTYRGKDATKPDAHFNDVSYETIGDGSSNQKVKFVNGVGTVSLRADKNLTIIDLPVYVPGPNADETKNDKWYYVVKETSESDDYSTEVRLGTKGGFEPGNQTTKFDLEGDTSIFVAFKNIEEPKGELLLSKVGKKNLNDNQDFDFTIEAPDELTDTFKATFTDAKGTVHDNSVTFTSGVANVKLKQDEKLRIVGLPTGKYEVTEKGVTNIKPSWEIKVGPETVESSSGLPVGKDASTDKFQVGGGVTTAVTYTNQPNTGGIDLSKSVQSDDAADKNIDFKFDLESEDLKNVTANYTISGSNGSHELKFDKNGKASLNLKHGQTAHITDLPDRAKVKIIEQSTKTSDNGSFETTVTVGDPDDSESESDTETEVEVKDDESQNVVFVNSRRPAGNLLITKQVNGPVNSEKFNFEITAPNDVRPDGEYRMEIMTEKGVTHISTVKFTQVSV